MSNENSLGSNLKNIFASLAVVLSFVVAVMIYIFVIGDPSHFDAEGHPLPGDYMGMVYKGGFIVPILIGINLIIITFSIERGITVAKAKGKGRLEPFVRKIKSLLSKNELESAISECDKQKGSLANVVRSGLTKYKFVQNDTHMDKEAKVAAIQKELEEATSLELPMLSKNLVIISTCASVSTLVGLIGTVLGMIRSFAALSTGGAPDTAALATGISEALINTALGITGSAIAIIMYNYFSTKIDALTYSIDEAGFTIVQEFNASGK